MIHPPPPDENRCTFVKRNGERCKVVRMNERTEFCYFHDPSLADHRTLACSLAGKSRQVKTLPAGTPELDLSTSAHIAEAIEETVNQLRSGQLDYRVGNVISNLLQAKLRLREQALQSYVASCCAPGFQTLLDD